jgi:hypothetical protein
MVRILLISAVLAAAVALLQTSTTDAGPISRSNPYRSFNPSGVNYGSMQWEIKHRNSNSNSSKSWSNGRRNVRFRWR